jgi:hypothetical protein
MENGHISKAEYDTHTKKNGTIDRIVSHLENGDHQKANVALQGLHKKLDSGSKKKNEFLKSVHREAISGEGKFKTKEGTATHVVTIGKDASVHSVDDFLEQHHPYMKTPQARMGKHGAGSTAVRLDTPKKSKRILRKK